MEEEVSRFRQSECGTRNRLQLLERQCAQLRDETSEMADTIQQLEQLNRQLRQELSKMMQPRTTDDSNSTVMWRHRVELLLTHNKVSFYGTLSAILNFVFHVMNEFYTVLYVGTF